MPDKTKCRNCSYEWHPRVVIPQRCPKCQSPDWNSAEPGKREARPEGIPPKLNPDVYDYFRDKKFPDKEAERFHDYHSARGWVIGRYKMKDWRAAARYWMSNVQTYFATPKDYEGRKKEEAAYERIARHPDKG